MSLLNRKRTNQIIKEYGKQCSKEFLDQLEYKVRGMIQKAVINARHFKRLKSSELL